MRDELSKVARVAVTQALRPGANLVEIRATNLWPNRLIGDEVLPYPDRFAPVAGTGSGPCELTARNSAEMRERIAAAPRSA